MNKYDAGIWHRFISENPNFASSVDYDVPIGGMQGNTEDLEPEWKKNAEYLGAYKVDAVAYSGATTYIIEVKPKAAAKAVGQVILYDFLYTRKYGRIRDTQAVIVTDEIMPDMPEFCEEHDILLISVVQGRKHEHRKENTEQNIAGNERVNHE